MTAGPSINQIDPALIKTLEPGATPSSDQLAASLSWPCTDGRRTTD